MRKNVLILMATCMLACFSLAAGAQEKAAGKAAGSKVLVAYFSATGTTQKVAKMIADATRGELYPIKPAQAYTAADLDWTNASSRSNKEHANPAARPSLAKGKKTLSGYDVVYLGFPIWWNEAPRIVNTFIESYDLKGKTVIPFATSGGSGISNSVKILKKAYPDIRWKEGKLLNNASVESIKKWVE